MRSPSSAECRSYLLILGDCEGLAWVLRQQAMAFAARRRGLAATLRKGDELFVYATRGCFGNPTRDRGRVIAVGQATSSPSVEPTVIAGVEYEVLVRLHLNAACPLRRGVELAPRVDRMHSFPDAAAWSAYMRKPLLHLDERDATVLRAELQPLLRPLEETIDDYLAAAARKLCRRTEES